ncbi:beta-galactosidase [Plantactinospora sp. DSM 117369]
MSNPNLTRRGLITTTALTATAAVLGQAEPAFATGQHPSRRRVTVGDHNGAPAILLNGQPLPAVAYMTYLPHRGQFGDFADAGYRLFSVASFLGDRGINSTSGIRPFRPGIWKGPNEYDFTPVDEDLARVLDARPDALVLLRVNLDVPEWWEALHPDELSVASDGGTLRQSFSSTVWKRQAGDVLRALIRHNSRSPLGRSVIAYHLGAGQTEEWMYHGNRDRFPEYSRSHQQAFRVWLRRTYRTDRALRAAWQDDTVSLHTATIPDATARLGDESRVLRDPATEQPSIDYYQFHSHAVADAVIHFCRVVKQEVGDSALAGAFYGYNMETTQVDVGQNALRQVLASPQVEFLASPNSYARRQPGNDWAYFSLTDSVKLHGKLWMSESDTRTHLSQGLSVVAPEVNPTGSVPGQYDSSLWLGPEDPTITLALLKNNLARALATGAGLWWFDMWGGWYDDPEMMAFMANARGLVAESMRADRRSAAQVAVVVDEESYAYFSHSRNHNQQFLYGQRLELGRMGTPYDILHAQDLHDRRTHHHKLFIFLNSIKVDRHLRQVVKGLRDQGRSFLWGHGAGWFGHGAPGVAGVRDLTGIEVAAPELPTVDLRVQTVASDSPALAGVATGTLFGTTSVKGNPLIHPTGVDVEVLANVNGTTLPGVVRVPHRRGGYSTYTVGPRIPPRFLQNAAREAGVHIYNDVDDVFYANHEFIALHATQDGPRTIRLPRTVAAVTDAFDPSRTPLARDTDSFTIECGEHETYLFRLDPGRRG